MFIKSHGFLDVDHKKRSQFFSGVEFSLFLVFFIFKFIYKLTQSLKNKFIGRFFFFKFIVCFVLVIIDMSAIYIILINLRKSL